MKQLSVNATAPLTGCTPDETLEIMDLWLSVHRMDACSLYRKITDSMLPLTDIFKLLKNYFDYL